MCDMCEFEESSSIPPKVEAAFKYLEWSRSSGSSFMDLCGGSSKEPKKLSLNERAVFDAALEVLRLYLSGEMDFAPTVCVQEEKKLQEKN